MDEDKRLQVNVDFSNDPELLETVDEIAIEDESDRSKAIRKIIRQERRRRKGLPNTGDLSKSKNSKPRGVAA